MTVLNNRVVRKKRLILLLILVLVRSWGVGVNARENNRWETRVYPGVIVVKFKPEVVQLWDGTRLLKAPLFTGVPTLDQRFARHRVEQIERMFHVQATLLRKQSTSDLPDISRIYRLNFSTNQNPYQVARDFAQDPHVEYAEPMPINYIEATPNDPQYPEQEHLVQIFAPEAWDIAHGDSNVVIAIVDNGTGWQHPDLKSNVWTNQAEATGLPNVDDDGNGYVDDVHGYDLAEKDADPTNGPEDNAGYYVHGTHVAGLAAAVTDNALGIAGVSWNCKYMPIKASYDNSPQDISKGYEGIVYAADNGADVINCSWGHLGDYSNYEQEVINYAYAKGSIIVAAAGNKSVDTPHYPSGYKHVISVTSVDDSDIKVNYAAWGLSVDIAAPGDEVLSTLPAGIYGRLSGTSMASPIVAGTIALVKSFHPDWNNERIIEQAVFSADNIDARNPEYAWMLGNGRVNLYRALTEENPPPPPPKIALLQARPNDELYGNGNGFFEGGETIVLSCRFRNYSLGTGNNVKFYLDLLDNPYLEPITVSSTISVAADTTFDLSSPLVFRVKNNSPGHMAKMAIGYTCEQSYSRADTISLLIGKTSVLVVDDDDGINNVEGFYLAALQELGVSFGIWDYPKLGTPSGKFLSNFPMVIWLCEWTFPSLTPENQKALQYYLDHGGNLFLSGQDIGWDLMDSDSDNATAAAQQFFRGYLHAEYLSDDSEDDQIVGVLGDPVGSGLSFRIFQPGRELEYQFPDVIAPLPEAYSIWQYHLQGGCAGVRYQGNYRTVYFGFGFEAIDAPDIANPYQISNNRLEVMRRVLDYLSPIRHQPLRDTDDTFNAYPVTVKLDWDTTDVQSVKLFWRKDAESEFQTVTMGKNGSNYIAFIPPLPSGNKVEYYLKLNTVYYSLTSPIGAPQYYYHFDVVTDTIPPSLFYEPLHSTINGKTPIPVTVLVEDNVAVNSQSVFLHYQTPVESDSVAMVKQGQTGVFRADLPPVAIYGDTVLYWFSARDCALSPNRITTPRRQFQVGYEDFEAGLNNWLVNPPGWELDTSSVHSGHFSITGSSDKSYENSGNTTITTNFGFDLSHTDRAALSFWTRYSLEIGHDYGYVEVSSDAGKTWKQLTSPFSGSLFNWTKKIFPLNSYCGPGFNDVRIRFRITTDSTRNGAAGFWSIDDILLRENWRVDRVGQAIPNNTFMLQSYPNPTVLGRPVAIRYGLVSRARVKVIIFNVLGQKVRCLLDEEMSAGNHVIFWDGRDGNGKLVAAGLYFYSFMIKYYSLVGKTEVITKKLLLLR